MATIRKTYFIRAPIQQVWQALVDAKQIESWGGGPVTMSDKPGADFSLWGGDIFGVNTEVKPKRKLVQEWYGSKDWKMPSIASFSLTEKNGATKLILVHSDVPAAEAPDFDSGWDDYYLGPIKELAESGQ